MARHGFNSAVRILSLALVLFVAVSAAPAVAQPTPQAKEAARRHFKRGKAAFEVGRFADALKAYEKAYEELPLPGFLFNIGQCHRNLGNYEKAIFAFKQYLKKKPNARNRKAVDKLLMELEQKAEEERRRKEFAAKTKVPEYRPDPPPRNPIVTPPPRRPPKPPPTPFYKKWWFWVPVAVLAAGGGAVGTYFAVRPKEATPPATAFPPWSIPSP